MGTVGRSIRGWRLYQLESKRREHLVGLGEAHWLFGGAGTLDAFEDLAAQGDFHLLTLDDETQDAFLVVAAAKMRLHFLLEPRDNAL